MEPVVGIGLAGGSGVRARPISQHTGGVIRSKAAIPFLGATLVEWEIAALREQGVTDVRMVARGRANRYQIKAILGYGERHGVSVRYSRARLDRTNTGSGAATLDALRHWDLTGLALVFPTDSVFELDLAEMVRAHRATGALVTVASVERDAATVAGKYGVLATDERGWAVDFLEKPTAETVRSRLPDPDRAPTNAGVYLVSTAALRSVSTVDCLARLRDTALDWGADLLPWLIRHGYPVRHHPIDRLGDLGTPADYLRTLREVLDDGYPSLTKLLGPATPEGIRVHESSLRQPDPHSGLSLEDKLAAGSVRLGPNVRIGREVEIGPGAVVEDCDLADGVEIGPHCRLRGVACQEGAVIGPHARLTDTYLGVMAEVASDPDRATVLDGWTALGDETLVGAGARLSGVTAAPGLQLPGTLTAPPGTALCTPDDIHRWTAQPSIWHG